jgi:hypothetical protein
MGWGRSCPALTPISCAYESEADTPLVEFSRIPLGSRHPIARFAAPTSWLARRVSSGSRYRSRTHRFEAAGGSALGAHPASDSRQGRGSSRPHRHVPMQRLIPLVLDLRDPGHTARRGQAARPLGFPLKTAGMTRNSTEDRVGPPHREALYLGRFRASGALMRHEAPWRSRRSRARSRRH